MSLATLYGFYCKRVQCKPNSGFSTQLHRNEVEVFDFSVNYIGRKGLEAVLEIVRNNAKLTELDLSSNWLEVSCIASVAETCTRHPSLTTLHLNDNPIHAASLRPLLYMLCTNKNLTTLSLKGTELTDHQLNQLSTQVENNRATENTTDLNLMKRITAIEVGPDPAAVYQGKWEEVSAGGCLQYATWRYNTQVLLYPSRAGLATITIKQNSSDAKQHSIGFAIVKQNDAGLCSILDVQPTDLVVESPFEYSRSCASVLLEERRKGLAQPYQIIPMTVCPGRLGSFTITVKEDQQEVSDPYRSIVYDLEEIKGEHDWWRLPPIHGEWGCNSAGGCTQFVSWRQNPQYLMSCKVATKVHVVLSQVASDGAQHSQDSSKRIGLYVVDAGAGTKRRIVRMDAAHLVADTSFRAVNAVSVTFELPGRNTSFVLIPSSYNPGETGCYTISVFSEAELEIECLDTTLPSPWHLREVKGEWTDATSGGARDVSFSAWKVNPGFRITTAHETDILILLQKHGQTQKTNAKTALHDLQGSAILEVCDNNEGVNRIVCEAASKESNVTNDPILSAMYSTAHSADEVIEVYLRAVSAGSYLIVPSTIDAGIECKFTLTLYSTSPLDLEPPRSVADRIDEMETARHKEQNVEIRHSRALSAPDVTFRGDPNLTEAVSECEAIISKYLRKGVQHTDREFPPTLASFSIDAQGDRDFPLSAWKRPCDHCVDASLFKASPQSGEVRQGMVQDLWFLGAAAMVATRPALLEHIFLSVYPEYGFYQLRFFKCGRWVPVTVDDVLPVDASNSLLFASSPNPQELWPAVLEKAYAKLHDSYEALEIDGNVSHALSDLTGGFPQEFDLTGSSADAGPEEGAASKEKLWIWDAIREALRNKWPVGFMLSSKTGKNVEEKRAMGIHPDHIFPLLEVREVRGNKLLRLRDCWGINAWKGKWRDGASCWTAEIADALQYEFKNDGTFWVGWGELTYYFTTIFVCRLHGTTRAVQPDNWECVTSEGSWTAGVSDGGNALSGGDEWVRNEQYSLEVLEDVVGDIPVWLQIEQRDARTDIIQTISADKKTLAYKTELGCHLVGSDCHARKLVTLTNKECIRTTQFSGARMVGQEFTITPSAKKYTILPCTALSGQTGEFLLFAACPKKIAIKKIQSNLNVSIKGAWSGLARGGAPRQFGTWRDNPMYLLSCVEATTLTVILKQFNEVDSTTAQIGFIIVDGKGVRRPLAISDEDIVASSELHNADKITAKVSVKGAKERGGLPYVIIPHTLYPRQESQFTLEVVGNKKATLSNIDPCLDYTCLTHHGEWSVHSGTAGGFIQYPTWRDTTQSLLKFSEPNARILVVLSKKMQSCVGHDSLEVGLVVMKGSSLEGGCRQKVSTPSPADIVAQTDFIANSTTGFSEVIVDLPHNKYGYIILPCTRYPYGEGAYQLSVYSDSDLQLVRPPSEKAWREIEYHGEWKPGATAGGSRNQHRTWGCNPSYRLTLKEHANVVVVLKQVPIRPGHSSGHLRPTANKKFRPPIIDERHYTSMAVDLCSDDDDSTHITRTEYVYLPEVTLTMPYTAPGTYLLVPHTFESELASEYTLTIYSDSTSTLVEPVKKRGRYY